jgi:soluble lytic murein transglycosylase
MLPEDESAALLEELQPHVIEDYYGVRVSDILSGTMPFEELESFNLSNSVGDQREAEDWLRGLMSLDEGDDIGRLSDTLEQDKRLIRGTKLWELGRKEEAKLELESVRASYSDDPLASYQLALFFRDLGIYRSSILAASSTMRSVGVDVFGAPKFLGRLAYPAYYSELVLEETKRYELDPLLLFALIRQESLYESFATSSAVAQGLAQVIPDTGQYIAQQLDWPDYRNEDLYKPYVGIAFGAYYLAEQIRNFDGDIPAALSAYNGGPGNAARWQSQTTGDIDDYINVIDFGETRRYIERIYTGHAVYKFLYGNTGVFDNLIEP